MALLPVTPPAGIVKNGTDYANKGRWVDGNLVRFENGFLKPVGGWSKVRNTALTVNQQEIEYKKSMLSAIMTSNKSLDTRIVGMERNQQDNYIYGGNAKQKTVKINKLPFFMK